MQVASEATLQAASEAAGQCRLRVKQPASECVIGERWLTQSAKSELGNFVIFIGIFIPPNTQ